jgi:signal transduction histidine kinase
VVAAFESSTTPTDGAFVNVSERVSLRSKAVIVGGLVGLTISIVASGITWSNAQSYLLRQRETTAQQQSFIHAELVARAILAGESPVDALTGTPTISPSYRALLKSDDEWLSLSAGIGVRDVPPDLLGRAETRQPAEQRGLVGGQPAYFVTFPIDVGDDLGFVYIGVSSLSEIQQTVDAIRRALLLGVAISAIGGALIGVWLSRRVMEPLKEISSTSVNLSSGDLEARVRIPREPDLARISHSFNQMADALQHRLEAESRFAAQAAHELRSPLTALRGTADILQMEKAKAPSDIGRLVDALGSEVAQFEKMLEDLLVLGRQSSGSDTPNLTVRQADALFSAIMKNLQLPDHVLCSDVDLSQLLVRVDVTRLRHVFGNLVANAALYANGVTAINVRRRESRLVVEVDDDGPGVAESERGAILEPFSRGRGSHGTSGSGLGLSIAAGHLRSMGSNLHVGSSPSGGARFSFDLEIASEDEP